MAKRKNQQHNQRHAGGRTNASLDSSVSPSPSRWWLAGLGIAAAALLLGTSFFYGWEAWPPARGRTAPVTPRLAENSTAAEQNVSSSVQDSASGDSDPATATAPTRFFKRGQLTLVWDTIKPEVRQQVQPVSAGSNIAPADYVGPEACQGCHEEQYEAWSHHPHRWMNALADSETVLGDFSGAATLHYRGGVGRFYREGERY